MGLIDRFRLSIFGTRASEEAEIHVGMTEETPSLFVTELSGGKVEGPAVRCCARYVTGEARNSKRGEPPYDQCSRTGQYQIGENVYCKVHAQIISLENSIALSRDLKDLEATFDLRWDADMRAMKMWQKAHPGSDLTWPDHADMVVWFMELIDTLNELDPKLVAFAKAGGIPKELKQ